jgi:hemerythrin-like domain-containing protein
VPTINEFMSQDHTRCDQAFVAAEDAVAKRDWAAGARHYEEFRHATEHHFGMEEEVLFPAFEERSGSTIGPTRVMRMEHVQMRELFEQMAQALQGQNADAFLGLSETLLVMMQQHNMKEEQILYPMTDQVLAAEREEVLDRMSRVKAPESSPA